MILSQNGASLAGMIDFNGATQMLTGKIDERGNIVLSSDAAEMTAELAGDKLSGFVERDGGAPVFWSATR